MKHLAGGMLSNRTLKGLSLAWNGLCDEGCFHVADMVAGNPHLEVQTDMPSFLCPCFHALPEHSICPRGFSFSFSNDSCHPPS